jgi:Glycosyltransferase
VIAGIRGLSCADLRNIGRKSYLRPLTDSVRLAVRLDGCADSPTGTSRYGYGHCRATAVVPLYGADDCSLTGYITGKQKDDVWNKASIYCMCSRHEGFPMVVLEAWA